MYVLNGYLFLTAQEIKLTQLNILVADLPGEGSDALINIHINYSHADKYGKFIFTVSITLSRTAFSCITKNIYNFICKITELLSSVSVFMLTNL